MEDFSNTYVSKQANVEPGKHPLVYAELCFMSAARFAVMLLDDTGNAQLRSFNCS